MRILFLLFAVSFSVYAYAKCDHLSEIAEVERCISAEYVATDKELNRIYKAIYRSIEKAEQKKLVMAQRAWLKYRDANCDHQAFHENLMVVLSSATDACLDRVTQARNAELKSIYTNLFQQVENPQSNPSHSLLGSWKAVDGGVEITFQKENGVSEFRSYLQSRLFESGYWDLRDGQLLFTAINGVLLRVYSQVQFDAKTLRLTEQDGTEEVYIRLK